MSGYEKIFFMVYIRTSNLIASSSIFFQDFSNMSKIHHMKKVMEDLNVFRKYFRARQEVGNKI